MQAYLLTHFPFLKNECTSPTKPFFRPSKISFLFCQETLPSTMCLYQCLHTLLDLSYVAHHDIHRPVLLIKVEQAKQKYKPIYVGLPNTKHWFTVDSVKVISHFLPYSAFFLNFHLDLRKMLGKKYNIFSQMDSNGGSILIYHATVPVPSI